MQSHNILITDSTRFPTPVQPSQNDFIIDLAGGNLVSRLTDFLSSEPFSRGTSINLVLDQTFIRYQYFNLPLISSRRIRPVLQFELDDTLLKGAENYHYSYILQSDKKSGITETGVYVIESTLLNELIATFRLFTLELRWITSLENLIDLTYREKATDPGNRIQATIDERSHSARFFTYHSGFLTGISALVTDMTGDTAADAADAATAFVNRLNQKINAIRLAEPDLVELEMTGTGSWITTADHQFIVKKDETIPEAGKNESTTRIRLDHPQRINLIKSNLLIIQELRQHARSMAIIAGILCACLVLYFGTIAYQAYHDSIAIQALEKRLDNTVSRYLPGNTSQSNAIHILRERIQEFESEKEKSRQFEQHRYQVARILTDLSLIKKEIPSLILSRFSFNEQVIRFQGQIESITEFDRMQESMTRLFPTEAFRINTNEKSSETGIVTFSTTIQQKQKR